MMTKGHDACPPGPYTLVAAEAHCIALPDCIGFTFNNASAHPNGTIPKVFFKNVTALAGGGSVWHSYLLDYATPWYQSIDGGESWTRFFTDARTQAVPNASFVRTVLKASCAAVSRYVGRHVAVSQCRLGLRAKNAVASILEI